jgi:AcrR family transcriptional regulator
MLGTNGLRGVALRQIGEAAGSANRTAVQYHFRDREALISAVFERRLPELDAMRHNLLSSCDDAGDAGKLRHLLHILFGPILTPKDEQGEPSYARFVLNLQTEVPEFVWSFRDIAPSTAQILTLIANLCPHLDEKVMRSRLRYATLVYLDSALRELRERPKLQFDVSYDGAEAALLAEAIMRAGSDER